MAEVLHGNASGDQLNAHNDKTQVYGLKGNDTLTSDNKSNVLLVGGSGNDSLVMYGGNGTLSGGDGSDTFELTYSADKKLSAIIEDLDPAKDKIVVNHDGNTTPQLTSTVRDNDVVLRDSAGLLNVTLKGIRENDYFDGETSDEVWNVLWLTNIEREKKNLPALTLSEGLTEGAQIRAVEITEKGVLGLLTDHTRLDNETSWLTVFDEIGKSYSNVAENLDGGAASPEEVVQQWMSSDDHKKNILDEEHKNYSKLGIGYNYNDPDPTNHRYYWTQWFAAGLSSTEKVTVSTADLLAVNPEIHAVSKYIKGTDAPDTIDNDDYGATIDALGGNDEITNTGLLVSVSGGDGADEITNSGADSTLDGGEGADYINNIGSFVTIDGGKDNDFINLWDMSDTSGNASAAQNNLIEYRLGDGNDTILAFNTTSTLSISGSEYTPWTLGNDLVVVVGTTDKEDFGLLTNEFISLRGAAYLSTLNIEGERSKLYLGTEYNNYMSHTVEGATIFAFGGNDYINNWGASSVMDGGVGNDTVTNWAANSTIFGNDGSDSIRSNEASCSINGGEGGDYLNVATGPDATISGGGGNDSIFNNMLSARAVIFGDEGDDSIQNAGFYPTIEGGTGNDFILNTEFGLNSSIGGGEGNDTINNYGNYSKIFGGANNDLINNDGTNVTINGGTGNDGVNNYSGSALIELGEGNDTIYNEGSSVTINGELDNDLILLSSNAQNNLVLYKSGDSRDTVVGFNEDDTLQIGDGTSTYSSLTSGDHIAVNVGTGSVLLWNAASLSAVNIKGVESEQSDEDNFIRLTETPADYKNTLEGAIIQALNGDDSITNTGNNGAISGEEGNDSITNSGNNVAIFGREGDDTIFNEGSNTTILGDAGKNDFFNLGENVLILGDDDNDTIFQGGANGTIIGYGGDDEIMLVKSTIRDENGEILFVGEAQNNLILYEEGNGNDSIWGFNAEDTLRLITDPSNYSTQTSGNDVIVNVGSESVKLVEVFDAGEGVLPALNIVVVSRGSGTEEKLITLTEGDDRYTSYTDGVTIAALGGNDSVTNYGSNVSIDGGNDNDTLNNRGSSNTLIGGSGKDSIHNSGASASIDAGNDDDTIYTNSSATINAGSGNNSIRSGSKDPVSIVSGAGNDTIYNGSFGRGEDADGDNATIESSAGDDSIVNYGWNVSIDAGDDKDYVYNTGLYVTINAGAGNDDVNSWFSDCSIAGGDGDDTVWNTGDLVTIDGGTGNDDITNNDADEVLIYGGEGNDTIENKGSKVTINGGMGDDRISLSSDAKNNLINYTVGDGNDTIWGYSANTTLNISGAKYATEYSGDDIVYKVGNGSITLIDARDKPLPIIIGESASSGGSSGNNGGGNNSSSGSGGGRGGNDGGSSSGGRSASEGRNSDASGGRSAVGSAGASSGRSSGSSGGGSRIAATNSTDVANVMNSLMPSTQQTTVNQRIYAGGNQIISDYQSGEKVIFNAAYTGSFYDEAGNYCVGSSTGALVIQNAVDKVIDLSDGAGNAVIKSYAASTAGIIDGRGIAGFELINGSAGEDAIFAGDGGSQLWGGADVVQDIMVGGGGTDIFIGGRTQGADIFLNASSADVVHLNDATLSDIIATEENNGTIAVAFNTGNAVAVQSSEVLSATFMLADGSAYRYNHSTKNWQNA